METTIRQYTEKDLAAVTKIWNEVVAEGNAFPQDTPFTPEEARAFFASQTFTGVAESGGRIVGFYILHPNKRVLWRIIRSARHRDGRAARTALA